MSRTGKPTPHTDLLMHLYKALTQEQFNIMKTNVKSKEYGGFLAGELEKISSLPQLLDKMEHKGVFRVKTNPQKIVDYRKLKTIMKQCENEDALNEILATEKKLAEEGYYVESDDYADTASCSAGFMETNQSFNENNSRSDRSDAIPSDIHVTDSGDGGTSDGFRYNSKGKGYMLYVNNFEEHGEPRRKGSEKDKDSVEAVFEDDLNFKCVYEKDLTKQRLLTLLQKTRDKLSKGNYSSFFLIISSHGEQHVVKNNGKEATVEGIVTIDKGEYITEEELTKPFLGDELKALSDKPKVFIIQACRAPRPDQADDMETSSLEESPADPTPASVKKPVNADMLISYATTKGTKAWRNDDGTWYISELCRGIKKFSKKKHLADILVRVNHAIALRESTEESAKQMPCQISTLTKDFWL